ncbi:MAG: hypothetical protein K1Y36_04750 [Blastocatellia bacterium]|nr:hypothetical protein [Blastocatellia bacterium]
MPDPKQPPKPRSTEEILREMEAMSKGVGAKQPPPGPAKPVQKEEGALKSLLGFFIKIDPADEPAPPAKPVAPPPAPAKPAASAAAPPQVPPVAKLPTPDIPVPRPAPRVGDLVANEPLPKFSAPEKAADDLSQKPFPEIYQDAGVSEHNCDVDELERLLNNPTVANQPMSIKVVAVNLALSAKGIGPDVPIADAMRRDRALDAYQDMLFERARTTEQRNQAKIQQLQQEVEEYLKRKQAEIETLRMETNDVKRQSDEFAIRREVEEKRMANLISPFLQGKPNPVTVGNQPGEPKPE